MLLTVAVHPSMAVHPSTCPADGIFPTHRQPQDYSVDGISPLGVSHSLIGFLSLGGLCLYTPHMRFPPLGGVNADMPTGSFSAILRESKLSVVGIAHIQSLSLCCRIFPLSNPLFDVPLMELPPLGAQTLAYEFPSSEPMGG